MADRFIITGFPRSRTGWLANLFTYGSCFCLHDGLQHVLGRRNRRFNLWEHLDTFSARNPSLHRVGNSDSGIPLVIKPKDIPAKTKVVIVRRPQGDAERSYVRYFSAHPYPDLRVPTPDEMHDVFERTRFALDGYELQVPKELLRVIDYSDLDHAVQVQMLWEFIVPDEPFNADRWALLNALRVNPASEKVRLM